MKHGKDKSPKSKRPWPTNHHHRKRRKTKKSPTYRLTVKMSIRSRRSYGKYDYHDKKSSAWWTPATHRLAVLTSNRQSFRKERSRSDEDKRSVFSKVSTRSRASKSSRASSIDLKKADVAAKLAAKQAEFNALH